MIHGISVKKAGHTYVFLYGLGSDAQRQQVLRSMGRMAANPDLNFSWHDAAVLSRMVSRRAGSATDGVFPVQKKTLRIRLIGFLDYVMDIVAVTAAAILYGVWKAFGLGEGDQCNNSRKTFSRDSGSRRYRGHRTGMSPRPTLRG